MLRTVSVREPLGEYSLLIRDGSNSACSDAYSHSLTEGHPGCLGID
jgi:hypothetical protein